MWQINANHNINKLGKKENDITSFDAGREFDKIQHPLLIKKLSKVELGHILNMIKFIYEKLKTALYLLVENNTFPLNSGIKQGCILSSCVFNILLDVLHISTRQENKNKRQSGASLVANWV